MEEIEVNVVDVDVDPGAGDVVMATGSSSSSTTPLTGTPLIHSSIFLNSNFNNTPPPPREGYKKELSGFPLLSPLPPGFTGDDGVDGWNFDE